eukprot:363239-Chlamydomonas_euryale.AAC.4
MQQCSLCSDEFGRLLGPAAQPLPLPSYYRVRGDTGTSGGAYPQLRHVLQAHRSCSTAPELVLPSGPQRGEEHPDVSWCAAAPRAAPLRWDSVATSSDGDAAAARQRSAPFRNAGLGLPTEARRDRRAAASSPEGAPPPNLDERGARGADGASVC